MNDDDHGGFSDPNTLDSDRRGVDLRRRLCELTRDTALLNIGYGIGRGNGVPYVIEACIAEIDGLRKRLAEVAHLTREYESEDVL